MPLSRLPSQANGRCRHERRKRGSWKLVFILPHLQCCVYTTHTMQLRNLNCGITGESLKCIQGRSITLQEMECYRRMFCKCLGVIEEDSTKPSIDAENELLDKPHHQLESRMHKKPAEIPSDIETKSRLGTTTKHTTFTPEEHFTAASLETYESHQCQLQLY